MKKKCRKSSVAVVMSILVMIIGMLPSAVFGEEQTAPDLGLQAHGAVLMEASTGQIVYEKAGEEHVSPASITKIMTLILIFDALDEGSISLEDEVITSAYAQSMGGSQVFLEEGEVQTVDTLIKCIIVSSGNDACVAMAEYLEGSETEFVKKMNKRAESLGMKDTHFEDCCGLTDSDGHYTSARDVALMSRELITRYPKIKEYSTIWMDTITHVTKRKTSEFGLANTNKLLKQYQWTTGLKTGSTSKAKYCVSATAEQNGMELIAVIMGAPDYKVRFSEAKTLLEYGYSHCSLYRDSSGTKTKSVPVENGCEDSVKTICKEPFSYLATGGENVAEVKKKVTYAKNLTAPVKKGQKAGAVSYYLKGNKIGETPVIAAENVEKAGFENSLHSLFSSFLL